VKAPMNAFEKIVVIGGSAGGIDAMKVIAAGLPPGFPAPVLVALHVGGESLNVLDQVIGRAGALPTSIARGGERILPGHIYIARADHHLLVTREGTLDLTRGPKENRVRPAIDPLFRSAAVAFGPRVLGVILTGWLDDGTAGLWAVKDRGGIAIVQHPEDAFAPDMPLSALRGVEVNRAARLNEIAPLLVQLAALPLPTGTGGEVRAEMQREASDAQVVGDETPYEPDATASPFACPECHGVLSEISEGPLVRFRCHTGHAYSPGTLLTDYAERTEIALWNAIRSLEETEMLLLKSADQLEAHQDVPGAQAARQRAARERADGFILRQMLAARPSPLVQPTALGSSLTAEGQTRQ
jgi:two-component system, chemotaxis family, protein-glutamate methylesterase/glutaminase